MKYPARNYDNITQSSTRQTLYKRMALGGAATFAALILSGTSALGFTNYLANPGFETGARGAWIDSYSNSGAVDSTNGFVFGSGTIHEPAHGGQYALKTWGTYWGGGYRQNHTNYQYIAAAPDSSWSGDVWVITATPDNIKNNNYAQLLINFYDASSNVLSDFSFSSVFDTNMPVNTWIHLVATNSLDGSTNLVAPVGTAYVQFGLVFSLDETASGGSVYWDDANLIKTASSDPEISASPQNVTLVYGQTATLNVAASGRTSLSYKWQKDGADISDGGKISGATTATLTLSNVTTDDMGSYTVTVTDAAGSLSSSPGYLAVLDPGILTNPAAKQVKLEGQTATFTVAAAGSGTLTYAWSKDGVALSNDGRVSGADGPTLTISNLTTADSSANYLVQVSGAGTPAISAPAALFVKTIPQASNLMLDGGFETGTTVFWGAWNGYDVVQAIPGGETNYDGNYVGEARSKDEWNGMNQSFPVTHGAVYTANGWFLQSSGALISGASEAWLEINFYNNNGILMTSFQSAHFTSNSVVGVWTNLVVPYATPPAGANETRCQVNFHAPSGGGAIFFDDVSFWIKIPVAITASDSGSNLLLSFPTQIGVNYQVLYKDDLNDATWQVLTTLTGDMSGQASVSTPKGVANRFYRVNTL